MPFDLPSALLIFLAAFSVLASGARADCYWPDGTENDKHAPCYFTDRSFVVTMPEPISFKTIGISPSVSALPASNSLPSSTSTIATMAATISTNSTTPVAPTNSSSGMAVPPVATTVPPLGPSSAPPPSDSSAAVPLAVGVSVGGASLIVAGALGVLIWRRRKQPLARAESPPPRDTPDDDFINPVLSGPLFRSGSLQRRPSNNYMNTSVGTAPGTSVLGENHAHNHFGPNVVAMHSMRRTPPASWDFEGSRNGSYKAPEIPYDGRRLDPYHGMPLMEHDGYSELPG